MKLEKEICELKIDETAYCRKIMLEGSSDKEVVTAMHGMQKWLVYSKCRSILQNLSSSSLRGSKNK